MQLRASTQVSWPVSSVLYNFRPLRAFNIRVLQKEKLRMLRTTKYLVGVGALAFLLVCCKTRQLRPEQLERGGEWLSWSQSERDRYVYGFLDGWMKSRMTACGETDKLFEVGQPHRMGDEQHPTDIPSGRCLAAVDTYSRFRYADSALDISVYSKPITEFYTKHPEYAGIPFPFLLEYLGDKKCSTSDGLYRMALTGKLHVIR